MTPSRPTSRPKKTQTNQPTPGFIAVGLIHSARGVRGELRVQPLSDIEGRFDADATLYIDGANHKVVRSRTDRHGILLTLENIADRRSAEALHGKLLEVPESESPALAEGSYYRHQIIGLRVLDIAGTDLGRIEEVLVTGANDVFVVRDGSGETLIPALDSIVKRVDVAAGEMLVDLIPGLTRRELKPPHRAKPIQTRTSGNR